MPTATIVKITKMIGLPWRPSNAARRAERRHPQCGSAGRIRLWVPHGAEAWRFLKKHKANLEHVAGVRYPSELGHPFHVIDDEVVILSVYHPFVTDGRVGSLMVGDAALASRLANGFETLWAKAMRNLREISSIRSARLCSSAMTSCCRRVILPPWIRW